jgi:hypothetical protein
LPSFCRIQRQILTIKTTVAGANPQLILRNRQGLRQRYILAGVSVLLTITSGILYWMLQQTDAVAEVKNDGFDK